MPPVSRYMTPNPRAVAPRDRLSVARALMHELQIRHLPVIDHDRLVGILSDRDLNQIHAPEDNVADAMSPDVTTVAAKTPIDEVVALMEAKHFGSVVVMGDVGVAGIFTLTDAMRAFTNVVQRSEEGDR